MKAFSTTYTEKLKRIDPCVLICAVILSAVSCLMLFGGRNYLKNGGRLFIMQVGATVVGIIAMLIISMIDYETVLRRFWIPCAVFSVGILAFTLKFGVAVGENRSWLDLKFMTIQPSEFVKTTFIVTFAKHLDLVKKDINKIWVLGGLGIHAGVVLLLLLRSGDLGVTLVFCGAVAVMLFCAGLSSFYFLGVLGALFVAVPYVWPKLHLYQQERIIYGFNPEGDPLGRGMQPLQGRSCVESAGFFGKGFDAELYRKLYSAESDFSFSTVCEMFGMIGGAIVIITLAVLVIRIFMLARTARKDAGSFICVGVAAFIMVQSIENIGMCLAMLPVVGITLPLISGGGSSTLAVYLLLGMVQSVASHRVKYFFEREGVGMRSEADSGADIAGII